MTKQQSLCRTDRPARRDDFSVTRDLELAQAVQERLLPQGNLNSAGLCYQTYYRPLHRVGGDYYDFVSLDRNKIGIAIGDVSGKGVGAALTMASLQASLRARVLQPGTGPLALVRSLNRLLYESSLEQVFASLFYAEYDPNSQCLTYVNAGHNPPLVLRTEGDSAGILRLEGEGMPVGLFSDSTYREVKCALRAGDTLVAYTDGITEARNQASEQWGLAGLEAALAESAGMNPSEVVSAILRRRGTFTGPTPAEDDVTLVVAFVEWQPNAAHTTSSGS